MLFEKLKLLTGTEITNDLVKRNSINIKAKQINLKLLTESSLNNNSRLIKGDLL